MKNARLMVAAFFLFTICGFGTASHADGYQGVRATAILTSTSAANGQKLSYLKTDNPEVTAMMVEIPPGGETGWHTHAVPVYAYVLSGCITVEMEGQAIFEVTDTPHNGRNNGSQTAKLVVFYTGEVGKPNVTRVNKPESKSLFQE